MKKHLLAVCLFFCTLAFILAFVNGCSGNQPAPSPSPTDPASIKELDFSKETAIKAKFAQVEGLAEARINVKVVNLECTLEGSVTSEELKKRAEELARSVNGVKEVYNNIEIK